MQMFEKHKGKCDVKDPIVNKTVQDIESVVWPAILWESVPTLQTTKDEQLRETNTTPTVIAVERTADHSSG